MNNFNELLQKEMFDKTKPEKVPYKLVGLFIAFPNNKSVLSAIEDYYVSDIKNNKSYSAKLQKDIFDILKKNWLLVWNNETLTMPDLEVIHRYFEKYTPSQQNTINSLIEKSIGEEHKIELGEKSKLSVALKQYKKGNCKELNQYIAEQENIPKAQLYRISKAMRELNEGTLPIWCKAVEKSHKPLQLYVDAEIVLAEKKEDIIKFIEIEKKAYEYEHFSQNKEHLSEKEIKEKVLYNICEIYTEDKSEVLNSVANLFYKVAHLESEKIITVLDNLNHVIELCSPILQDILKKDLKIKNTGIESLFAMMPFIEEDFDSISYSIDYLETEDYDRDLDFDKFKECVNKIQTVYTYRKLSSDLTNKDNKRNKHKL